MRRRSRKSTFRPSGGVIGPTRHLVGEQGPEMFVPNPRVGNTYQIKVTAGPTSDPGSVGQAVVRAVRMASRRPYWKLVDCTWTRWTPVSNYGTGIIKWVVTEGPKVPRSCRFGGT